MVTKSPTKISLMGIIRESRAEPYFFLIMFGATIASVTVQQMLQDKICRNNYNQTEEFCRKLPQIKVSRVKEKILADAVQFSLYSTMVETIPGVILAMAIGPVCDKLRFGRKLFMCLAAVSGFLKGISLMLNGINFRWPPLLMAALSFPPALIGSTFTGITCVFSFVSVNSNQEMRAIRITILDVLALVAYASGPAIGAKILMLNPLITSEGQLFNYIAVYGAAALAHFLAFIWAYFVINEKTDGDASLVANDQLQQNHETGSNDPSTSGYSSDAVSVAHEESMSCFAIIVQVLKPSNFKDLFETLFKKRPESKRTIILSLGLCHILFMGSTKTNVMFAFVERMYGWNAQQYSYYSALAAIIAPIVLLVGIPILTKIFKVDDVSLGIMGTVFGCVGNILAGSILTPLGMFLEYGISSLSLSAPISTRTILSKTVPKDEITKIFSALTTLEAFLPFVAGSIYTFVFNATISYYPTAIFHLSALYHLISLILFATLGLFYIPKGGFLQSSEFNPLISESSAEATVKSANMNQTDNEQKVDC